MCGQDSIYSTTTNPSYIPSNSNQINAMSSSLVAGSGFLTDRQVHIILTVNNKHSKSIIVLQNIIFTSFFKMISNCIKYKYILKTMRAYF